MTTAVTLEEVLTARERRAMRQADLAREYGPAAPGGSADRAVVSVTLVVPGPDKNPPWAPAVFAAAMRQVADSLAGARILHTETHECASGPHGYAVVEGPGPREVKRSLVRGEESHRWGRLFDLDVVVDGVPLQRSDVDAAPRRCLVCDGPASPCARSRAHDLPTVLAAIEELLCS